MDKDITEEELSIQINKMKNGKAEVEDKILNEFLKYGASTLKPFLLKLCNGILCIEKEPNSLRYTKVSKRQTLITTGVSHCLETYQNYLTIL